MRDLERSNYGRFDYTSGKPLGAPVLVDIRTYPTRVIDGTVYVDID
jgi:3-phenylpropionate/trans-cinnamate dioxygenase ferredoxin subunit